MEFRQIEYFLTTSEHRSIVLGFFGSLGVLYIKEPPSKKRLRFYSFVLDLSNKSKL